MLRLFNMLKVEQLGEKRMSTFFVYTLGEIVLVVLGILIALSIDNWNRERLEQKELKEYLVKISENVSEDLVLANVNLDRRMKLVDVSKNVVAKMLKDEQLGMEDISNSIEIFVDFHFVSKKSGMHSLTNAGFINKLEQSRLDSLLFEYYLIVEDLQREEQSFNGFIESMEAAHNSQTSMLPLYGSYFRLEVDKEEVERAEESYFQSAPVQSALLRGAGQNAMLRRYRRLIETGELLKKEIELLVE